MLAAALHTRAADPADRRLLDQLLSSAGLLHNHLDWNPPHDWLGKKPFQLAFLGNELIGALAAPPDPPQVAWIRVAAVAEGFPAGEVLDPTWAASLEALAEARAGQVNCMLLEPWLGPHLERWDFSRLTDVVILRRQRETPFKPPRLPTEVALRPARPADMPAIAAVDNAAFAAPWQYSANVLQQAMGLSTRAVVALLSGEVVGYEISSGGRSGGHLARLAVHPNVQGRGIARHLVAEMVAHFEQRGAPAVTVNTQRHNLASLAVYQSLGFQPTGEAYPVWQRKL